MINIGKYIEMAINWLTENFTLFFDAINVGIGGFIDGFQNVLMWIPFYITIVLLTLLAWYKSGKGVGVFTVFGLLLIWSMGFWNETMQTLALVLSSTIIALIIGLPLGIWSANSQRCDKILHPILDLMQTMPAFVYLIPAVLFFGLGTVPGAFATIIFATPPVVRLTSLGIKQVPKNVVEASRSFGATPHTAIVQSTIAFSITHHHDRYQSNHPDVTLDGGNCSHDCGWRFGRNRIERHHTNENRSRI